MASTVTSRWERDCDRLKLKFQMRHPEPVGHRMLRWTDEASTSAARSVARYSPSIIGAGASGQPGSFCSDLLARSAANWHVGDNRTAPIVRTRRGLSMMSVARDADARESWSRAARPISSFTITSCIAAGRLFTFTRLDPSQWKSARTTNATERLNEEFRRRIKTQTVLPCAETVPMLLWALMALGQIHPPIAASRDCRATDAKDRWLGNLGSAYRPSQP
jgi:hypothetical protein